MTSMQKLYLLVPMAPLAGAIVAGLLGWLISRRAAHWATIIGMLVCVGASALVYQDVMAGNHFNGALYTWMEVGNAKFQIGFLIFIPFLVIDMIVASVLMSLGMMMLSPVLVALPFKLMLFVMADGWNLLMGSLAASFLN